MNGSLWVWVTVTHTHRGIGPPLWTHISMHTHATGDFKNTGPKQTDACQSYTTQLHGLGYEKDSYWLCNEQNITNKHTCSVSKVPPLSLMTWEILSWPDMWFEMTKFPMGALLEQTHASPFIPHIDRKHALITELQHVLIAMHIPGLYLLATSRRIRINPFLRLHQHLIYGGPLKLVLTVKHRLTRSWQQNYWNKLCHFSSITPMRRRLKVNQLSTGKAALLGVFWLLLWL